MPGTSVFAGLAQDATLQTIFEMLGTPPTYEVDSLSTGAATAGSVALAFTWDGIAFTTQSPIPFNASAAAVATIVQSSLGAGNVFLPANSVRATGGPLATAPVVLIFENEMVGPVTAQVVTPTGLTAGTATFTRTTAGSAGGLAGAIANSGGGPNPGSGFPMLLRGQDGKMYHPATIASGDGIVELGVYVEGGSAQGNVGSGGPASAFHIASRDAGGIMRDIGVDSAGNISLQSSGADGAPTPSKTMLVGGSDGTNLQNLLVDVLGRLFLASMAVPGTAIPSEIEVIGGKDSNGNAQVASISQQGALATMDSGNVPVSPISVNGVAFVYGQAGAPQGPVTVTQTGPFAGLPDSTGSSSIAGPRGEYSVQNIGNVDICVCQSTTPVWGGGDVIPAYGSYARESYAGPVSIITQNKRNLVIETSPVALAVLKEWA